MAKTFTKTKHHLLCLTVPPVRGKPRFNKSNSKIKTPQKSNSFLQKSQAFCHQHPLRLISTYFSSTQFSHSVVSDSLLPHESQYARPPCPSPTPGVYSNSCPLSWWCHPATCLITSKCAQSCSTLCYPVDCSPADSSVHEVFQARILNGLPFPTPGHLSHPGIEPESLTSASKWIHTNKVYCILKPKVFMNFHCWIKQTNNFPL